MKLFDAVWTMYLEFVFAAQLAQQECIGLIEKYRFSEAGKAAVSRDGYYDCAMMALKML
jgi:hypothetical protein